MREVQKTVLAGVFVTLLACCLCPIASAEDAAVLTAEEVSKVVPTNFYFAGQVAPTQVRNAAAVRFQAGHHFVAALVDTSGYASNIRSKYEGFLIMDAPVTVGGTALKAGAYGFGFTDDLKLNIMDLGANVIHTIAVKKDADAKTPRPLYIVKAGDEYRLCRGKNCAALSFK
jgi:hypothetical protein